MSLLQVAVDKGYVAKVHLKERNSRYEDPPELLDEQLALGGPSPFSP